MTYLEIGLWISSPFQRRWRLNEAVRWGWPSMTGVLTRRRHPAPGMCTHRAKATGELGEKEVVGHRGSVSARDPHCRHLDLRLAASRAVRSAFLCVSRQPSCMLCYDSLSIYWINTWFLTKARDTFLYWRAKQRLWTRQCIYRQAGSLDKIQDTHLNRNARSVGNCFSVSMSHANLVFVLS